MNTFEWRSFLSNILLDLLTNEKPDERQIMTYVSCYYHAFQGAMQVDPRVEPRVDPRVEPRAALRQQATWTWSLRRCDLPLYPVPCFVFTPIHFFPVTNLDSAAAVKIN